MRKTNGLPGVFFLLVTMLFLVSGCDLENIEVGPIEIKNQSVEARSAETVRAEIKLGAGELRMDGGAGALMDVEAGALMDAEAGALMDAEAGALMDAEFIYNVPDWEPEVSYSVDDGRGNLLVSQPSVEKKFPFDIDDVRYEWDLRFDETIPLDLVITLGAGEGNLELDNLNLTSLDFEAGAGSVEIDLSGSTIQDLAVKMGAGEVYLDLSGRWDQDLDAVIQGGLGSATLRLPAGEGVSVEVNKGLGEVNVSGLSKNGNVYTNAAYGDSEVTLDIMIQGGVGSIDLEVVE